MKKLFKFLMIMVLFYFTIKMNVMDFTNWLS